MMLSTIFPDLPLYKIPPESNSLTREGNRSASVVVVLDKYPEEGELEFLKRIFMAAEFSLSEDIFQIIVPPGEHISILPLLSERMAQKVFLFGCTPEKIGLQCTRHLYKVLNFGGRQWIFSQDLKDLREDPKAKKLLWLNLKTVFGL